MDIYFRDDIERALVSLSGVHRFPLRDDLETVAFVQGYRLALLSVGLAFGVNLPYLGDGQPAGAQVRGAFALDMSMEGGRNGI